MKIQYLYLTIISILLGSIWSCQEVEKNKNEHVDDASSEMKNPRGIWTFTKRAWSDLWGFR